MMTMTTTDEKIESHTLTILVDNEPGVLARVIGLFSGRGYNIESLTVSEISESRELSRITIVTPGTPSFIAKISAQVERLIPVHRVYDLSLREDTIFRELALLKVAGKGENRVEALRLAEAFQADVVDASLEHFVFELRGRSKKITQFIELMKPLGLVNIVRTGVIAVSRGSERM